MCGILFTLSASAASSPPISHVALISHRGPDAIRTHTVTAHTKTLTFTSSLLSVRGTEPTPQPLIDAATDSVLCWNGEAWRINGSPLAEGANDTREVFEVLLNAPEGKVQDVIGTIEGEFAFVFWDGRGTVWFGRDWAGRRSLVVRRDEEGMEIASVGDGEEGWEEVHAGGVGRVNAESGEETWVTQRSTGEEVRF
jgi:asparagine synthetase B (glutamine-hydrolysing)